MAHTVATSTASKSYINSFYIKTNFQPLTPQKEKHKVSYKKVISSNDTKSKRGLHLTYEICVSIDEYDGTVGGYKENV